ncbi:MFS transporter [Embleya sp. MST-111070]|uniref:MFS transporter n=1 Tax=Embleya sp. MST-111070 TaxID=3398231 RepID=UPI003F736AA5
MRPCRVPKWYETVVTSTWASRATATRVSPAVPARSSTRCAPSRIAAVVRGESAGRRSSGCLPRGPDERLRAADHVRGDPVRRAVLAAVHRPRPYGRRRATYYTAVALARFTSLTVFYVPYGALGAELSTDPTERTALPSVRTAFSQLGALVGAITPLALHGVLGDALGGSDKAGWSAVATCRAAPPWEGVRSAPSTPMCLAVGRGSPCGRPSRGVCGPDAKPAATRTDG